MKTFSFCVITFEPIFIKTCVDPQNDCHNLGFVKNKHKYGDKKARKGCTQAIYKVSFISKHSLNVII